MAEFPDLGKHCEYGGCNSLDFLPFDCTSCKKSFCKVHKGLHKCTTEEVKVTEQSNSLADSISLYALCAATGCSKRNFRNVTCSICQQVYCNEHRLPEQHKCGNNVKPVIPQQTTYNKPSANSTVSFKYQPIVATESNILRMRQIAQMKHKSKMLQIYKSTDNGFFFAKTPEGHLYPVIAPLNWTINRCLSTVLEQCNIDPSEASKYKLRFVDHADDELDSIAELKTYLNKYPNEDMQLILV